MNADRIGQYRRDGFVVEPDVLDDATLAELRAVTDSFAEAARGLTAHTDAIDLEDSHRPDRPRIRRIKRPFAHHPFYDRLARSRLLVDLAVALLGPDVRLQSGILNYKSPGYGAPVEWHQDWPFYPHTNDDLLAIGIFLDDVTADNGPVLFFPGTHRGPVFDHHRDGAFVGALDLAQSGLDPRTAVPALGRAGSVSIHHCRVVHGSATNTSDAPRRVCYFEYNAGDAFPILGLGRQYSTDPEQEWQVFNSRLVAGSPTTRPRLERVPVQLPLPKARRLGSIYENQKGLARRFFPPPGS